MGASAIERHYYFFNRISYFHNTRIDPTETKMLIFFRKTICRIVKFLSVFFISSCYVFSFLKFMNSQLSYTSLIDFF